MTLRVRVAIGGEAVEPQLDGLSCKPDGVVVMPGLSYLLREVDTLSLRAVRVRHLVVDEADSLFDMGFALQLQRIMDSLPAHNSFTRAALHNPVMIRLIRLESDTKLWRQL